MVARPLLTTPHSMRRFFCALLACMLTSCTTININNGSGSLDAPSDTRVGRKLGPLNVETNSEQKN